VHFLYIPLINYKQRHSYHGLSTYFQETCTTLPSLLAFIQHVPDWCWIW